VFNVPFVTAPNATLEGLATASASMPVPLSGTATGEPGALLLIEMLPEALPSEVAVKVTVNVADDPAAIEVGCKVVVNPAPVIGAAVMFKATLPLFVKVRFCTPLLPTLTLPNASDDGFMLNCGCAAMPVPASPMSKGEPGAVFATEMPPLAFPAAVGAKVTVTIADAPGVRVCGDSVLMLNPAPLAVPDVIDTFAVPEFVRVTFTDAEAPVRILPKLMLAGLAVNAACVPVPPSVITSGEFVAVEATVIVPDAVPAAVGANFAVHVAVPPAAICCPDVIPLTLNPAPAAPILFTVIAAVPELVNATVCVPLPPTSTFPKLKLPGFALKVLPGGRALPVSERVCGEFGPLSTN
jgi:hypothetical protein